MKKVCKHPAALENTSQRPFQSDHYASQSAIGQAEFVDYSPSINAFADNNFIH